MADIREIIMPEDVEHVAGLFDAYRQFYHQESDLQGAHKFLSDRIINQESRIFIAYINDRPAGFVQLYPFFTSVGMRRTWVLNDLYVDEMVRGKGIGRALIEHVQELCQQEGRAGIMLETEVHNKVGNALYQSSGFNLIGNNFYFWKA